MKIRIFPYKPGSRSAKALRDQFTELGHNSLLLRREGSRFRPSGNDLIINWGASGGLPDLGGHPVLNRPESTAAASSKLTTLRRLEEAEVPHVQYTVDPAVARQWNREGHGVYARRMDRGHSGNGIVFIPPNAPDSQWVTAPLYTKQGVGREYRVHVIGTKVVLIQKKYKAEDDSPVRSHDNGYTLIRDGFRLPNGLKTVAVNAVSALGLDFGAVDVVNAQTQGGDRRPRVLEINTAVGMEGSTPNDYARTILEEFTNQSVNPVQEPTEERDHRDDEDDPASVTPIRPTIGRSHRHHPLAAQRSADLGRVRCSFCDGLLAA